MKLTRTAGGKTSVTIARKEWQKIGEQNGWTKAAGFRPAEVDALIQAASECGHRLDPDSLTQLWQRDPKLVSEMYAAFKGMAAGRADTELKDEQARQERVKEDKAMGVKGTPWVATPEELREEGYAPPAGA